MDLLTLENPVFWHWCIAAAIGVLKVMGQGWMTVRAMTVEKGGYVAPEDLRKTSINPNPDPAQLGLNERVERSRRMHRNDLENIPAFWVAGLIFVAADPPLWSAILFFWGFVAARAAHAVAYGTAQTHDMRAIFYTLGSVIVIVMALWSLIALIF